MLLLDNTYFVGELRIPQLPTSRVGEEWADFGTAKMIQATAENELLTFIDLYVHEYLVKLLGTELAEDLINAITAGTNNVAVLGFLGDFIMLPPPNRNDHWAVPLHTVTKIDPQTFEFVTMSMIRSVGMLQDLFTFVLQKTERTANSVVFTFETRNHSFTSTLPSTFESRLEVTPNGAIIRFPNQNFQSTWGSWQLSLQGRQLDVDNFPYFAGLRDALMYNVGSVRVSPMAHYVWWQLHRDAANYTTQMGEADLNFARATVAYEADKTLKVNAMRNRLVNVWNKMGTAQTKVMNYVRNSKELQKQYRIPFENWRWLTDTANRMNL